MAKMITVSEAAKITGSSSATIRRLCENGTIKGAIKSQIKIGNGFVWLVPENALDTLEFKPYGKRASAYKRQ